MEESTWLLEVYYGRPVDSAREEQIAAVMTRHGGHFDFHEEHVIEGVCNSVCVSYEFVNQDNALAAAGELRSQGMHVEGPDPYG